MQIKNMIFDDLIYNLNLIINDNKTSEKVYNTLKIAQELFDDKQVSFRLEPKMKSLINGMAFKKDDSENVVILVGQKYYDTYNIKSSLHHTILIHELKHLHDYNFNQETFFESKEKEKYFYEFDAKIVEAEFIKYYLKDEYNLSKAELFILESFEKDDLDMYSILFQRVSKQIYAIFKDFEIEYKNNLITLENIVKDLFHGAYQLFSEYNNSKDDFTKFTNYVRIKSFRNCLEDIELINEKKQNIVFDDIVNKYIDIGFIHSQLYEIIDSYNELNKNYLLSLDAYLENNYMEVNI